MQGRAGERSQRWVGCEHARGHSAPEEQPEGKEPVSFICLLGELDSLLCPQKKI